MLDRLQRKLLYSRWFRRLIGWAQRMVLPGFEGFNLYQISRFFFNALATGRLDTRASAIAFKVFLAFFPAVIVLLTLIPYVPIDDFQIQLLSTFREMMPSEVFKFIESTLNDLLVRKHGALLSVSFLVAIYLASNSINAILMGFSASANHIEWHSPFKQRLLSFGLMFALSILMVIAIPLLTMSGSIIYQVNEMGFFNNQLEMWALFGVKWLVSILVVIMFVSLLYNAGDPTAKRFKFVSPGVLLAMFLILIISQALAYTFSHITDYNALYGSIGAILAVQFWIYLNMVAMLVGYELNTSIVRARRLHKAKLDVPAAPAA